MEAEGAIGLWDGLDDLRPALNRYLARRCRDESEADDVVQETFIRASRYRRSLADPARLKAWVLRIATNVLRDHVRRERRLPRVEGAWDVLSRMEGREAVPGELREEAQMLLAGERLEKQHALSELGVAQLDLRSQDRVVLDCYYAEHRTCAETGLVCDIGPALVKVRLFRARKRLQRVLCARLRAQEGLPRAGAISCGRGARCAPPGVPMERGANHAAEA